MDNNLICICETLREKHARPRNELSSRPTHLFFVIYLHKNFTFNNLRINSKDHQTS